MSASLVICTQHTQHSEQYRFSKQQPRTNLAGALGVLLLFAAAVVSAPSTCRADDEQPTIVGYSLEGLWTGAATGLAIGYLTTGSDFRAAEWSNIGWGTAIGALSGLGVGILLGTIDASTMYGNRAGIGFYMIRDSNYGVSVGFLAGTVIGTMLWIGGGTGQDLLRGMAWGTIIGASTGLLLGVLEGVLRSRSAPRGNYEPEHEHHHDHPVRVYEAPAALNVRLSVGFTTPELGARGAPVPYPSLVGTF